MQAARASRCIWPLNGPARRPSRIPYGSKNLLRTAESDLQAAGRQFAGISRLLQPARELLDDFEFWQHQGEGLAILAAPDLFRRYRLQLCVPELAVTAGHFHLKPLLAWIAASERYYVLALTQDHVRVFRATAKVWSNWSARTCPGPSR